MPTASETLNPSPHYRQDLVRLGLQRAGFNLAPPKAQPDAADVLVIWNRQRGDIALAERYEAAGARVIVMENGYLGRDERGSQLYAMALSGHAGSGHWREGPEDRWSLLQIGLAPWRRSGREIIVLPQRGIGCPGVAMPAGWTDNVVARLKARTNRPVRVRPHPGRARTDPYPDLQDAWACVTWASGAGLKALIAGVPVFYEMPTWIGGSAAKYGLDEIDDPLRGDRLPMFRRLAWAQWSADEIGEGAPFRWLLA